MKVLSLQNSLKWSWAITSTELKKRFNFPYVRVLCVPGVNVSPDLTDYFDVVMVQNVDRLEQIEKIDKEKTIARMGGMHLGEKEDRFDDLLKQVNCVIATNEELAEISRKSCDNVYIIPNGIDLDLFRPLPKNKKTDKFTLGFSGNITGYCMVYKGWKYFADVRSRLYLQTDKVVQNLKNMIPHEQMPKKFFAKIDVLILPSVNEGSSHIIMESLACGVPVICTKVGYHGENLTDMENVIFCKRDPDDIERKVKMLMNDKKLQKKLSKNGRKFAIEHHNIEDVANKYKEVIKKIYRR
ncbi:MAG: glycosyltransferase family 4 protein [Candidatus Cloacimonetes bacterium]|nr:glycosyltransferase family 4 protein [Candidatus Cloacimonadota bacterium]